MTFAVSNGVLYSVPNSLNHMWIYTNGINLKNKIKC